MQGLTHSTMGQRPRWLQHSRQWGWGQGTQQETSLRLLTGHGTGSAPHYGAESPGLPSRQRVMLGTSQDAARACAVYWGLAVPSRRLGAGMIAHLTEGRGTPAGLTTLCTSAALSCPSPLSSSHTHSSPRLRPCWYWLRYQSVCHFNNKAIEKANIFFPV